MRRCAIDFLATKSLVVAIPLLLLCSPSSAHGQTLEWIQQFGTSEFDDGRGASVDGLGNVYLVGGTNGDLWGPNAGESDVFVCKYDSTGSQIWSQQFGTRKGEAAGPVSLDGMGNIYIAGMTGGNLAGDNAGKSDAFVSKYDPSGNVLWTQQFGSSEDEAVNGLSADSTGNVYITGYTEGDLDGANAGDADAFIAKFDSSGSPLWTHQFGTSHRDVSTGISVDTLGNVFVAIQTLDSSWIFNAQDPFIAKFDASGRRQSTWEIGVTPLDFVNDVWGDGLGGVYVAGGTSGDLGGPHAGKTDVFIARYDPAGALAWVQQFGSSDGDVTRGLAADGLGNVYITGLTGGDLQGASNGMGDAFVAKYDASGERQWLQQFGTSETDMAFGVAADDRGNVYVTGPTYGDMEGVNAGDRDGFLIRFSTDVVSLRGDFDSNGVLDVRDIDDLTTQSAAGTDLPPYDLDGDALVNSSDIKYWINDLFNSWIGDANLDGKFNSSDLVTLFMAGEYEDNQPMNSTWTTGDFNGDGDFDSTDLVAAFDDGGYENGPRAATRAVPEPTSLLILVAGTMGIALRRRKADLTHAAPSMSDRLRRSRQRKKRSIRFSTVVTLIVANSVTMTALNNSATASVAITNVEPSSESSIPFPGSNHGWAFTANANIEVTHLGLFDHDANGFEIPHPIGLWHSDGTLLARSEIGAGDGAPLIDYFRYIAVPALTLNAGEDYVIGFNSELSKDMFIVEAVGLQLDPAITYLGGRWGGELGSLNMPVNPDRELDRFGPNFQFVPKPSSSAGDFSANGVLDAADLNLLTNEILLGTMNLRFDVNDDGAIDHDDHRVWIKDLAHTWYGDSNLDGEFNSSDLVAVFEAGKYEQDVVASWSEGDWNGDGRFGTGDLVTAFEDGGYEQGEFAAASAVPEPASIFILMGGLFGIGLYHRCNG